MKISSTYCIYYQIKRGGEATRKNFNFPNNYLACVLYITNATSQILRYNITKLTDIRLELTRILRFKKNYINLPQIINVN